MSTADVSTVITARATRLVRIGGVPRRELKLRLEQAGVRFNASAERLFDDSRFVTAGDETLLKTVEVSVADLGLCDNVPFAEIVRRAANFGLDLCPLELGPHLRLQYTDQPEGFIGQPPTSHCAPPGSIVVASAPLDEHDDTPKGFYLRRIEGALWLRGYHASPDHPYRSRDVFVFCRLINTEPPQTLPDPSGFGNR